MLWFGKSLWPSLTICAVLYVLDYYLTIIGARLYRAGAQQMIFYEGSYELTPRFQTDVDQLRWFSPRFVWSLVRLLATMSMAWWLTKIAEIPQLFSFYLGLFVVLQLAVQKRHLQNIFLFRTITKPGAVSGQIRYSRAFILRQSGLELLAFTALFGLLSLFIWNLFVLGGAVGCLSLSIRDFRLAKKSHQNTAATVAQEVATTSEVLPAAKD
jgi:hypothetical protein